MEIASAVLSLFIRQVRHHLRYSPELSSVDGVKDLQGPRVPINTYGKVMPCPSAEWRGEEDIQGVVENFDEISVWCGKWACGIGEG